MKTTGRAGLALVLIALALAACTRASGDSDGGGGTTGTGPSPDVIIQPGTSGVYRYANAGLLATLDLPARTLEVQNDTGRELGKPAFYVLNALDGSRVDGRVLDPGPIPAGETVTFAIELDGIAPKDIGLIVLLIGRDNYGAFVQQ